MMSDHFSFQMFQPSSVTFNELRLRAVLRGNDSKLTSIDFIAYTRCVNYLMRLILFNFFIRIGLQFNINSLIILPKWLPIIIAVVELWYWNSLQLVGYYSHLNVFEFPRMIIFKFWEEEKDTKTQVRRIRKLRCYVNVFTG